VEKSQAIAGILGAVFVEHRGRSPDVHASAWVAPTAVIGGDARPGADVRVPWNAVISAADGRGEIGHEAFVAHRDDREL
jgi:carbonic anhydrase/acetyltransferase-like protein (isoleucine patch superfamily)